MYADRTPAPAKRNNEDWKRPSWMLDVSKRRVADDVLNRRGKEQRSSSDELRVIADVDLMSVGRCLQVLDVDHC